MDLWLAALIIVSAAGASAAGMLMLRRHAPAGTFFKDVIPAGAVYTVVGTAYMGDPEQNRGAVVRCA